MVIHNNLLESSIFGNCCNSIFLSDQECKPQWNFMRLYIDFPTYLIPVSMLDKHRKTLLNLLSHHLSQKYFWTQTWSKHFSTQKNDDKISTCLFIFRVKVIKSLIYSLSLIFNCIFRIGFYFFSYKKRLHVDRYVKQTC